MQIISREEYLEKLKVYILEEMDRSGRKPSGFYGNWAFEAIKEAEFRRWLDKSHIQVQE